MTDNKKLGFVIVVLSTLALLHGCAINRATATVDQTTDFSKLKVFYVRKYSNDVHRLPINDKLLAVSGHRDYLLEKV